MNIETLKKFMPSDLALWMLCLLVLGLQLIGIRLEISHGSIASQVVNVTWLELILLAGPALAVVSIAIMLKCERDIRVRYAIIATVLGTVPFILCLVAAMHVGFDLPSWTANESPFSRCLCW